MDKYEIRPVPEENTADLERWFPRDRAVSDPPAEDIFEIALVIAGSISAGCYSAGVLDYLFEALDAWHAARAEDPDLPNHKVRLKIVVGASAGGLNAALAMIVANRRFPAARNGQAPGDASYQANPFYGAWVNDIDITDLLDLSDLEKGDAKSILNSDYLEEKVAHYVRFGGGGQADPVVRAWIDDPLPARITVSNLDGVPFAADFDTQSQDPETAASMSLHRDQVSFERAVFDDPPAPTAPDCRTLQQDNIGGAQLWSTVSDTVLATIAFPILLAPRRIERPNTDYDYRFVKVEGKIASYPEAFPGQGRDVIGFAAVDGGVMNNEPFEIAHDALAGTHGLNERSGATAKRAVIMIDPIVDPPERPMDDRPPTFLGLLARLFSSYKMQAQFRQSDLRLARSSGVYSRYLIAPVRRTRAGGKVRGDRALASKPLMALMGFFSIHYRHHDFMLGRDNCRRFLRDWFVLPSGSAGNTLFAQWPDTAQNNPDFQSRSDRRSEHKQIIPLLDNGDATIPPDWPATRFAGFRMIEPQVEARVRLLFPTFRDALAAGLSRNATGRFLFRRGLDLVWAFGGRRRVLSYIETLVEKARKAIDDQ